MGAAARAPVIDLHAHPSTKTYLFRKKLNRDHRPGATFDPLAMRVDLPSLITGGVSAVISAVYLPELGLLPDCFFLRLLKKIAPSRWKRLFDDDRFQRTIDMIDDFESVIANTPPVSGVRLAIARSTAELDAIVARDDIALVHAVEGGHSLNGDPTNVERLFARGVCMITLVHFYPNGVAYPVDGIPDRMKFLGCFSTPEDLTKGLDRLGPAVIEEMVRLGVIIDMTHCTPIARRQTLDIVKRRRPVLMSHVGVTALNDDPMNATDAEIRAIAEGGGVIGVIAMNDWLGRRAGGPGIDLVVRTLDHVRRVGGIETAGLGTDFDGFTDPPDDLAQPDDLPTLTRALSRGGFSAGEIEKVLGGNARRVLEEGWGRNRE